MKINYRRLSEYKIIDIDKLRPKGSYANLIARRTHSIDDLIRKHGTVPPDLLRRRDCPGCGQDNNVYELEKDNLNIVRCNSCNLVYVNPIFDEAHYEETYASEAYQEIVRSHGEKSHEYRRDRFGVERVQIMKQFLEQKACPSFLDIGCSTGFVVEAALAEGWEAKGIDLNPSAVAFGIERGLPLRQCTFQSFASNGEKFDAIGLFDVLEHILHPRQLLEQVADHLKPDGIVFIYVPNYDSASRLLMGKDAHFIWPTHHLTYFTPLTLKDFVENTGLSTLFVATEGLDIVDYVWSQKEIMQKDMSAIEEIGELIQFFINGSLYGKNLRLIARKK